MSDEQQSRRGRPKGSKNKPKRGRPKGSTKTKQLKKELPPNELLSSNHLQEAKETSFYKDEEEAYSSVLDDNKLTEPGYNLSTDKIINEEPIDSSFYYRGSKHVPVAGAQYEFTADMIEELRKCKNDIVYFAENFFYIVSLDKGKQKIELYEAQKRVLRSFVAERNVIVCSSRQIGKCFSENTIVKVRNKNTGEVEEITIKNLFESILTS